MGFIVVLLGFIVVCYGITGIPMMLDKGTGYFVYALILEALMIALFVFCLKKYRSPEYKEKMKKAREEREESTPECKEAETQSASTANEENTNAKKPLTTKEKVIISCAALFAVFVISTGVVEAVKDDDKSDEREENEVVETWRDNLDPKLVDEIESAFAEIGENPDNIINVEYVDIHTSGYVFEQKCYKVEFSWSLGNPGYKHSRYYRIVTQNYYDGEPEKEQHPDEFLCTIKYWIGDDGHGTNVNQWSWTGNGEMQ